MTAPEQGQQQGQQGQQKAKAKVKALDVVQFTHRDPILGEHREAVGVVREVPESGSVTIRPLAHHTVQVDPADIAGVITADDV